MDLVAGVRKEGSRGGRAEFKWTDVTTSTHRENYLGHSLMAPVGRWQKNKDLSWYAKGDKSEAALSAAEARREEIRKVKEAEQDALSEALGFGPAPRREGGANANEVPLGEREVQRVVREIKEGEEGEEQGGKGLGFGSYSGANDGVDGEEVLVGEGAVAVAGGTPEERALKRIIEEEKAKKRRRSRSRSRSRSREPRREGEKRRRSHRDDEDRARRRHHHAHHHGRDRSRDHQRRRSRERDSHKQRHHNERYRERSYERRRSYGRDRRSYSRDRDRNHESR